MLRDDLQGVIKLSIGVLCIAAFVLILIILSGNEFDDTSGRAIGTAVALAFLSLTAVAGTHLRLRQPHLALLGGATVAVSALAFLATTAAIWSDDNWELAGVCLILAFAGGHSSVLLAAADEQDDDSVRLVRGATIVALGVLALLGIGELADAGGSVPPQAVGVVAVLYALGALILPLLRRSASGTRLQEEAQPQQGDLELDHRCLVWPASAESAVAHLQARGLVIVKGPEPGLGAHGIGTSVFYREPGGGLVELISYR